MIQSCSPHIVVLIALLLAIVTVQQRLPIAAVLGLKQLPNGVRAVGR